jgi:excisionase family DNA binding protein
MGIEGERLGAAVAVAHRESQPRLLSLDAAAHQLSVSARHLRNLAARGQLRIVRLGRSVRVPREEIERLCG